MSSKSLGQITYKRPLRLCNMEELAAHQRSTQAGGGVLFARNPDGEQKTIARQHILDMFTPQAWPGRLNMLTMPGVDWRFERKLLGSREPGWMRRRTPYRTHFTAVENDRAIYYAGASQMPGIETPNALVKPVKRGKFQFAEQALKTRYTSFFFANVDDLLQYEWEPAPYREHEQVGWDAAWLDYTGPLSKERLSYIQHFYERAVRSILIVTALKARWNRDTVTAIERAGGHSEWLRKHLPGEVLHDLEYFDTSPMAQFAVRRTDVPATT